MNFPPDNALKKLRREVAAHEAETEIATAYNSLTAAEHKTEIHAELKRMHAMILELKKHMEFAFPDADLGKHHAEHLSSREDKAFWQKVRMATGTGVLWLLIVLVIILAVTNRK